MTTTTRWGAPETLYDGHRLFTADDGRIAIADDSGSTPDRTDDGVLWLDFTRFLGGIVGVLAIPVVDDEGNQTRTVTDLSTLLLLATRYGWAIDTGAGKYGVCEHERTMVNATYQGERWMVHGYEWEHGEENRDVVVLKKSPKDRRRSGYDWDHAPVAELQDIEWVEVTPTCR